MESGVTSLNRMKCDQNIVGLELGQHIRTMAHVLNLEKENKVGLVGGEMSCDKLLGINQLCKQNEEVFVLGEVGLLFAMVKHGLEKLSDMKLEQWQYPMIQYIIEHNSNLVIPTQLVLARNHQEFTIDLSAITPE